MDPILKRLLLCVKSMIETLPFASQKKAVMEFNLSTRYLQPLLQTLFDNDNIKFKWSNEAYMNIDNTSNHDRPDGCVENDDYTLSFVEVKPIDKAKDHKMVNTDLYRLGVFSKAASTANKLKHMFQILAVGSNLQFHLSEFDGDVLKMVELDNLRLPLSMDEHPQIIPYMHKTVWRFFRTSSDKGSYRKTSNRTLKNYSITSFTNHAVQIKQLNKRSFV